MEQRALLVVDDDNVVNVVAGVVLVVDDDNVVFVADVWEWQMLGLFSPSAIAELVRLDSISIPNSMTMTNGGAPCP